MRGHHAAEVAKTVIEVADVAWTAVESSHHPRHRKPLEAADGNCPSEEHELESLRSENRRLKDLLHRNLKLLHNLSESPPFFDNCPPDLHNRLVDTVKSDEYLTQLKVLQQESAHEANQFPFKEAAELDYCSSNILISVDSQEPSWWVWVTDEPSNVEERSGIDDENYLVLSEKDVVDGVANFMARCILSNPKAQKLSPEELQKSLSKALSGTSKLEKILDIWHAGTLFYALSTWGLALTGLYHSRAAVRVATKGIHSSSKLALKVL